MKALEDRYVVEDCGFETSCWTWQGTRNDMGYGRIRLGDRFLMAHRFVWEQLRGPCPEGLEADHLCEVAPCVNPDHIEWVTHRENVRRHLERHPREPKEFCKDGHAMSGDNLYIAPNGTRQCRACNARRAREQRARRSPYMKVPKVKVRL